MILTFLLNAAKHLPALCSTNRHRTASLAEVSPCLMHCICNRIQVVRNPYFMCMLIKRTGLSQIASIFVDLLCLSRRSGNWSIFWYVSSPSFHFSWLICWCHTWQFVSLQFAPMEITPAHVRKASDSSLHSLHNLGAVRVLPQCAHLSILSKLMNLSLLAAGILHTLTYSQMISIKSVKCFEN